MRYWQLLIIVTFSLMVPSAALSGRALPHIKTFGFDYAGQTTSTSELQWLATHHDAVVGITDYSLGRMNVTQFDTMKAANSDVLLMSYSYHTALTTAAMRTFFADWVTANGLTQEDVYIHYAYDQPVKIRVAVVKTTGTGTPSDRICDAAGNLLSNGASGTYYLSLGYPNGTASTLADARVYQYWNSGWEPRGNHMHSTYFGAFKAWTKSQIQIATGKNLDGIFLDTYDGPVLVEYSPNMHLLKELIDAGQNANDTTARTYYSVKMAEMIGELRDDLQTELNNSNFFVTLNGSEPGYTYSLSKIAIGDQLGLTKLDSNTFEYLASPSKTTYWGFYNYTPTFIADITAPKLTKMFNQIDTAWYNYGAFPKPPIGGKQHMIGSFYLYNEPNMYFGLHYGSGSNYGPRTPTGAYSGTGLSFVNSHWDKMLEYDIGTPVTKTGVGINGATKTDDKMYVVEKVHNVRWVMARDYTKGKVIVRYEQSNNNTLQQLGTDPRVYQLGDSYQRLLEDGTLGPVITEITLGLSEGAVLAKNDSGYITCYRDMDNDGYGNGTYETVTTCSTGYYIASHFTALSGDCDDDNANVRPGSTDTCGDGVDQDCSGGDAVCVTDPPNGTGTPKILMLDDNTPLSSGIKPAGVLRY